MPTGWRTGRRRAATSEISSTQWTLRTARAPRACESPITRADTAGDGRPHQVAKGERYAHNSYWQKTYCLRCFLGWAPSATVRKLGLTPAIDEMLAKAAQPPDEGDA